MDEKELNQILDENDFSWIKVKKFQSTQESWEEDFKALEKHHKTETEFLIKKCRELANDAKFGTYILNMIEAFGDAYEVVEDRSQVKSADAYISVWSKQKEKLKEQEKLIEEKDFRIQQLEDKLSGIRRGI